MKQNFKIGLIVLVILMGMVQAVNAMSVKQETLIKVMGR